MDTSEIVTLAVTLFIALGGWFFAWLQIRENHRIRLLDNQREIRQKKIDRALAYLDDMADLAYLYRVLANYSERLVTDEDGKPILDDAGAFQVDKKSIYADSRLEEALKEIEGKDTRNYILLQAFRIHRQQGAISDLLGDLDPSGDSQRELGLLYLSTVRTLEQVSNGGDFNRFNQVLEEVDDRRESLRKRIQGLIEQSKLKQP